MFRLIFDDAPDARDYDWASRVAYGTEKQATAAARRVNRRTGRPVAVWWCSAFDRPKDCRSIQWQRR